MALPLRPSPPPSIKGCLSTGQLRNLFIIILAVHAAWVAIYLAFAMLRHRYQAELRQAQLGKALQAAELRLLKSQLNPHFLFNALNGLRSLIADEPARARDAVTQLARTLRYTLASGDEDLVSLERELEMVDDYLALSPCGSPIVCESNATSLRRPAPRASRPCSCRRWSRMRSSTASPPLKQGGTLRITAQVVEKELSLRVVNPRPDDPTNKTSEGVGLRNATERLRLLFGSRASLKLDLSQAGQATAEIRLPS